jgi:hypothetical protein
MMQFTLALLILLLLYFYASAGQHGIRSALARSRNANATKTRFDYLFEQSAGSGWSFLKEGSIDFGVKMEGHIIKKTIFSGNSRLFFAAGLEGTGHQAFSTMLTHAPCDVCACACNLSLSVMNGIDGNGLFWTNDNRDIRDKLFVTVHFMKQLVVSATHAGGSVGQLHILGLDCVREAGMLSYPNYGHERFKVFDHPDLTVLASIAEHVQLDLRILVLLRGATDILISTVDRRKFSGGNPVMQAKVLIVNAAVLYAQLQSIDRQFYSCVNYEDLSDIDGSEERSLKLQVFLHSELTLETLRAMFSPVVYHDHFGNVTSSSDAHYESLLSAKMVLFKGLCADRFI